MKNFPVLYPKDIYPIVVEFITKVSDLVPKKELIAGIKEHKTLSTLTRMFGVSRDVIRHRINDDDVYPDIVNLIPNL